MRKILATFVLAAAAAGMAGFALAAEPAKVGETSKGKVLVDMKGMTLYTFDKDSAGKSACNGPCATNWPPLMASAGAKPEAGYTIVTRDDGSHQWAYAGKPLYTWVKDGKPGDVSGDGVGGVWRLAKP